MKACTRLLVEGMAPVGRPRKNTLSADMCLLTVDTEDAHNRKKWRAIGQRKANTAVSESTP